MPVPSLSYKHILLLLSTIISKSPSPSASIQVAYSVELKPVNAGLPPTAEPPCCQRLKLPAPSFA